MNTKKSFLIAAAVFFGLVGVYMIYGVIVAPARQPYRDALAQFNRVNDGNADLTTAGSMLGSTDASAELFEKNIKMANIVLENLRAEQIALSKHGVLQEGEGKKLFAAFDEKMQAYMSYTKNVLDSMQKVRPVIFDCTKAMGDVPVNETGVKVVRQCSTDLLGLEDVPDADYQELAVSFSREYTKLAEVLEKMAALPDPKGADVAQHSVLENERDQIMKDLAAAGRAFTANSKKRHAQLISTDASKKLKDYLQVKSRVIQL